MLCSWEVGLREQLEPEGTEEATSSFLIQLCHRQPYSSSTLNISVARVKCYRPCFPGEGPKAREAVELESGRVRGNHIFFCQLWNLKTPPCHSGLLPYMGTVIKGMCPCSQPRPFQYKQGILEDQDLQPLGTGRQGQWS